MKKAAVYIHGKGGSIDEANHYKKFFDGNYDVAGFDSCGLIPCCCATYVLRRGC